MSSAKKRETDKRNNKQANQKIGKLANGGKEETNQDLIHIKKYFKQIKNPNKLDNRKDKPIHKQVNLGNRHKKNDIAKYQNLFCIIFFYLN